MKQENGKEAQLNIQIPTREQWFLSNLGNLLSNKVRNLYKFFFIIHDNFLARRIVTFVTLTFVHLVRNYACVMVH